MMSDKETQQMRNRIASTLLEMMKEWRDPGEVITNEVVINFVAHTADFSAHLAKSFGISRKDFEKMCEVCTEGQWGPK